VPQIYVHETYIFRTVNTKIKHFYFNCRTYLCYVEYKAWIFKVFTVMNIKVVVLSAVTLCYSDMVGYQRFTGPCCLHLHDTTTSDKEPQCFHKY